MTKQQVSAKGVNKGKFKLNYPNTQELNQMSNEELNQVLAQVKFDKMKAGGLKEKGDYPPSGNLREMRITIARILTIQQKRR
jgi:ribosomal protein L29